MKLPDREKAKIVGELVRRRGFREFVEPFWGTIDLSEYIPNWHVDAIADHLQAVHEHDIKRLVVCMPPRLGKSKLISCLFPAYVWSQRPEEFIFNTSYDLGLVRGFAKDSNEIIKSPLFRMAFPMGATISREHQAVSEFENDQGGKRYSTLITGRSTGMGAHLQIGDDLLKASAANGDDPKVMANALEAWNGALSTRFVGMFRDFRRILVMQRLHPRDPAGHLIARGWEALVLPMEYSPKAQWDRMSSLEFVDPRSEPGELLFPAYLDEAGVEQLKEDLGAKEGLIRFVSSQLNQDPKMDGGAMVERDWFGIVDEGPWVKAKRKPYYFTTSDLAAKGEKTSHSRNGMGLWAVWQNRLYLCDVHAKHGTYPVAKAEFVRLHTDPWKECRKMLVEQKANGIPLLSDLGYNPDPKAPRDPKFPFASKLVAIDPGSDDKVTRFRPRTDVIRQGKVCLLRAPWNDEYLNELTEFPGSKWDDLVDITEMAVGHFVEVSRTGDWEARAAALGG